MKLQDPRVEGRTPTTAPPLDIEAALDLVLALAAHRSSDDKHSSFGMELFDQYFRELKLMHREDPIATRYLSDLLATMASAVRAFSVQRDIFGTKWRTHERAREQAATRAKNIQKYSPLSGESVWGKLMGGSFGGSVAVIIGNLLTERMSIALVAVVPGVLVGLLALDYALTSYAEKQIKKADTQFPHELIRSWETDALQQYQRILKKFLLSAIRVRELHYPHLTSIDNQWVFRGRDILDYVDIAPNSPPGVQVLGGEKLEQALDEIVRRHMAFG